MKTVEALYQNENFKKKVAQSFVPYSQPLSQAWVDLSGQDKQQDWGMKCAEAVAALDKFYNQYHAGEKKPKMTIKKLYMVAAMMRAKIESDLRGNAGYAKARIPEEGKKSGGTVLYTQVSDSGRYKDLLFPGLNALTVLGSKVGNEHVCAHDRHYFFTEAMGKPTVTVTFSAQASNATVTRGSETKQMLLIETFQHKEDKLEFACVRKYQWVDPLSPTSMPTLYFDILNPPDFALDTLFQHVEAQGCAVWDKPISAAYTKADYFKELASLMWYFPQMSPLLNGSAATSAIIMVWCLLRQFGTQAPLFFDPGLSADVFAMLSTKEDFQQQFEQKLHVDRPSITAIDAAYNVTLSTQTQKDIATQTQEQLSHRSKKTDFYRDLKGSGLLSDVIGNRVWTPSVPQPGENEIAVQMLRDGGVGRAIIRSAEQYIAEYSKLSPVKRNLDWWLLMKDVKSSAATQKQTPRRK